MSENDPFQTTMLIHQGHCTIMTLQQFHHAHYDFEKTMVWRALSEKL